MTNYNNTNQPKHANQQNSNNQNTTGKQGFASMDSEKQRDIASQGGKASHSGGNNAHSSGSDKSHQAGKKGM